MLIFDIYHREYFWILPEYLMSTEDMTGLICYDHSMAHISHRTSVCLSPALCSSYTGCLRFLLIGHIPYVSESLLPLPEKLFHFARSSIQFQDYVRRSDCRHLKAAMKTPSIMNKGYFLLPFSC